MLANGREGKRSNVSPFCSLVVSQKNWNVRRSMSRNSGGSSGRGGRSGSTGSIRITSGLGGGGSAASGAGVSCRQPASRNSAPARATMQRCQYHRFKPVSLVAAGGGAGSAHPAPCRRPDPRTAPPAARKSSPVDPERQLERTRRHGDRQRRAPGRILRLARTAAPVLVAIVVGPVEHVEDVAANAEADSAAGVPDFFHRQVELAEVLVGGVALVVAVGRDRDVAVLVVARRGVRPGALAGEGRAPGTVPDAGQHHPVLRHLAREPAIVLD